MTDQSSKQTVVWTHNEDDYEIKNPVGLGGTALVFAATHKPSNAKVAIKRVSQKNFEDNFDAIQKEVKFMKEFQHENLITYHVTFYTQREKYLYIVMPLMESGSLQDLVRYRKQTNPDILGKTLFSDKEIGAIIHFVLKALEFLHKSEFIHRDVKATNIFLNHDGSVKLGDFGVSRKLVQSDAGSNNQMTMTGTPVFMAPDMQFDKYNEKVDIWSLGIVLHVLSFGQSPFNRKHNPLQIMTRVATLKSGEALLREPFHEGTQVKLSDSLKKAILDCTEIFPDKRKSATELLKMKFFSKSESKLSTFLKDWFSSHHEQVKNIAESTTKEVLEKNSKKLSSLQNSPSDIAGTNKFAGMVKGLSGRFAVQTLFDLTEDDSEADYELAQTLTEPRASEQIHVKLTIRGKDNKLLNIQFTVDVGDKPSSLANELVREKLIDEKDMEAFEQAFKEMINNELPHFENHVRLDSYTGEPTTRNRQGQMGYARLIVHKRSGSTAQTETPKK